MFHEQLRNDPAFWKWFWSVWSFDYKMPHEGKMCCVCGLEMLKGTIVQRRKVYSDEMCDGWVACHTQCPKVVNTDEHSGLVALVEANKEKCR
jgi:hypothetical protein